MRAGVVRRYDANLTVAQVADRLHLTVGTAKRYLDSGGALLRDRLGAGDYTEDADVTLVSDPVSVRLDHTITVAQGHVACGSAVEVLPHTSSTLAG